MDDCTFNMVNIYAPQTDNERQTFFVKLDDFILVEHENIIVGDLTALQTSGWIKVEETQMLDIWQQQRYKQSALNII